MQLRIDPTRQPAVSLIRVSQRGMLDALRRNELDVVVDATNTPADGLAAHHLADDHLVAVVQADATLAKLERPLTADDLSAFPYLVSGTEPKAGFEYDAVFKRERASPTQLITVESVSLIAEFIARGYGTSIQPRHAARLLTVRHDIALRELASPSAVSWFAITRPAAGPAAHTLIERLRKALN